MSKDGNAREGGWAGIAKWRLYSSSSSDWSTPPPSPPVHPRRSFGGEIGSGCSYRAENTMTPFPIIGRYNHYLPSSSLSLSRVFRGREMWISLENYPLLVPLYERSSTHVRTGHDVTVEKALWITSHPLFDPSSLATRNWETDISVEKRWTFTAHLRLTTWRIWRA